MKENIDIKLGFFQRLFAGNIIENIIKNFSEQWKFFENKFENMQKGYKKEINDMKKTEFKINEIVDKLKIENENLKNELKNELLKLKDIIGNIEKIEKQKDMEWSIFKRDGVNKCFSELNNYSKDLSNGKDEIDKDINKKEAKISELIKEKSEIQGKVYELSDKCACQINFIKEYNQIIYNEFYDHNFISKNYQNIYNVFTAFLEKYKENDFMYNICFEIVYKKFIKTYENYLNIDDMHDFPSQWIAEYKNIKSSGINFVNNTFEKTKDNNNINLHYKSIVYNSKYTYCPFIEESTYVDNKDEISYKKVATDNMLKKHIESFNEFRKSLIEYKKLLDDFNDIYLKINCDYDCERISSNMDSLYKIYEKYTKMNKVKCNYDNNWFSLYPSNNNRVLAISSFLFKERQNKKEKKFSISYADFKSKYSESSFFKGRKNKDIEEIMSEIKVVINIKTERVYIEKNTNKCNYIVDFELFNKNFSVSICKDKKNEFLEGLNYFNKSIPNLSRSGILMIFDKNVLYFVNIYDYCNAYSDGKINLGNIIENDYNKIHYDIKYSYLYFDNKKKKESKKDHEKSLIKLTQLNNSKIF